MMKKIMICFLLSTLIVLSFVSAVCDKVEGDLTEEGFSNELSVTTYDEFKFGYTDKGTVGFGPNDNYDTCLNDDYLNEFYCDGSNAKFTTIYCEDGCESVTYNGAPVGKCIGESQGVLVPGEPEINPEIILCKKPKDIKDDKLNVRYKLFFHNTESLRFSMEAGIELYGGIVDTSELEGYETSLIEIQGKAKTAADSKDWKAFDNIVEETRLVVKNFKDAAILINEENGLDVEVIKDAMAAKLADNEAYLSELMLEAEGLALNARLLVFDTLVCNYEKKIIPGSIPEAMLEDIKGMRSGFENAIVEAQKVCKKGIFACEEPEAEVFREMVQTIKDKFKELKVIL